MKEEFKTFVRKRPELARYVNNGEMTWQKFYEQWSLYGEDEKVWENYKDTISVTNENKTNNEDNFSFNSFMNIIKNLDADSVQKGINSMQKVVELLQGLTNKNSSNTSNTSYSPRQLFKKFED